MWKFLIGKQQKKKAQLKLLTLKALSQHILKLYLYIQSPAEVTAALCWLQEAPFMDKHLQGKLKLLI